MIAPNSGGLGSGLGAAFTPPSYVSGTIGRFDQVGSIYNATALSLSKLRAMIAKSATSVRRIIVIGTSIDAGAYLTPGTNDWWTQFANLVGRGGDCVPAYSNTADARVTTNAGWLSLPPFLYSNNTVLPYTVAPNAIGTKVRIYYTNNSSPFTPTIDAVAQALVTPAGGNTVGMIEYVGLANTAHTVSVACASASVTNLLRIEVIGSTGILIENHGITASDSSAWGGSGTMNIFGPTFVSASTPDVVFIGNFGNDQFNGISLAASKANHTTAIGWATAAGALPILRCDHDYATIPDNAGPYYSQAYQLADTYNIPLIDYRARWGLNAAAVALGYLQADMVHPSASGAQDMARALLGLSTAA